MKLYTATRLSEARKPHIILIQIMPAMENVQMPTHTWNWENMEIISKLFYRMYLETNLKTRKKTKKNHTFIWDISGDLERWPKQRDNFFSIQSVNKHPYLSLLPTSNPHHPAVHFQCISCIPSSSYVTTWWAGSALWRESKLIYFCWISFSLYPNWQCSATSP